jgi:hypothetical protein
VREWKSDMCRLREGLIQVFITKSAPAPARRNDARPAERARAESEGECRHVRVGLECRGRGG